MASSIIKDNNNYYSGFSQTNNNLGIGYGLNEGYTALLDDRYFIHRNKEKENYNHFIYQVVKVLAENIEYFIGQEQMEDYYFKADLLSLCTCLSHYTSLFETVNFIHNIDLILLKYEQAKIKNYPLCFKKYSECMLYIAEAWLYRITEGYINRKFTKDEYKKCLGFIKQLLKERLSINNTFIKSIKLDDYYPIIKNKVDKKLFKRYDLKKFDK